MPLFVLPQQPGRWRPGSPPGVPSIAPEADLAPGRRACCAWFVDVGAPLVTAHRLESDRWVTIGTYIDETEAGIEPFDTVPLNIADWWPPGGSVEGKDEISLLA